jgi:hypothetical protein
VKHYQLAQVNIGRMLGALDSEVMAGFVAQLDEINALADRSPGFIWRLKDATGVQIYDDPLILVNMSVWESVETLRQFVYKSGHVAPLRDRSKWFEKPAQAHMAMWWVPAGHIPTVEEARERLEYRRNWGDSPIAFSFGKTYPEPEEPVGDGAAPPMILNNRIFAAAFNTPNGDCNSGTQFHYRQDGGRVWATYAGGRVQFGSLVAIGDAEGCLDMRYQHVDAGGQLRTGKCRATLETLADGRVRLHERWQWTNGDLSEGQSIVEELMS